MRPVGRALSSAILAVAVSLCALRPTSAQRAPGAGPVASASASGSAARGSSSAAPPAPDPVEAAAAGGASADAAADAAGDAASEGARVEVAAAPASAPSSSTSSSAAAPSANAPIGAEAMVRLKERKVFALLVEREGRSAGERARRATEALEAAFAVKDGKDEVRVERAQRLATIYVDRAPIVELDDADAAAAGAGSLDGYAADVSTKVQSAIAEERKRSAIANTVFSFALVVFGGLIAFLLLGKATQLAARSHDWLEDNPDRIPNLRVGGIELVRAGAMEAFLTLGIDIAKRLVQFGLLYTWAILSLSLFESTRGYTGKLTGLVLGPLSAFASRIGTGLPLAVATAIALVAIALLVRFTGVFFAGVVRGETTLDWVPQDLAAPVGVIVRLGIIVLGLILSAPLLTGSDDGVLARAGIATLAAFGLAATPVIACGILGSLVVFGRRLRAGDFVEVGGRGGKVREVTLLEVTLEDAAGCAVRVPHLLALLHPTRVMGRAPIVTVELVVDPHATQTKVRDVLVEAATRAGAAPRVELLSIDADGALYRVTLGAVAATTMFLPAPRRPRSSAARAGRLGTYPSIPPPATIQLTDDAAVASSVQLSAALADALARNGIALGRRAVVGGRAP